MKIDPKNGIPYELDHIGFRKEDTLPYALAQHSGPWHLKEAIQASNHVSADMDKADIIYVYDHCYYMLWLAQVHPSHPPPGPMYLCQAQMDRFLPLCWIVWLGILFLTAIEWTGMAFHDKLSVSYNIMLSTTFSAKCEA